MGTSSLLQKHRRANLSAKCAFCESARSTWRYAICHSQLLHSPAHLPMPLRFSSALCQPSDLPRYLLTSHYHARHQATSYGTLRHLTAPYSQTLRTKPAPIIIPPNDHTRKALGAIFLACCE